MEFTMMSIMMMTMMMRLPSAGDQRWAGNIFHFSFLYPFTILIAIMDFVTFLSLVVAKKVTARASNYEVGRRRRREAGGGWTIGISRIWCPAVRTLSQFVTLLPELGAVSLVSRLSSLDPMLNVNLNLITGLMMPQQRLITARRLPWYATLTWYQNTAICFDLLYFFPLLSLSLPLPVSLPLSLCSLPHLWVRVTNALSQQQANAGHAHNMMPNNATPHCVAGKTSMGHVTRYTFAYAGAASTCHIPNAAAPHLPLMWSCHGSFVAARFKCGYFELPAIDFAILRACWEDKPNLINFPEPDCGKSEGKLKLKWKFLGKGFQNCKLIWFLCSMEFLSMILDWYISKI